jgi:hypothetical protein
VRAFHPGIRSSKAAIRLSSALVGVVNGGPVASFMRMMAQTETGAIRALGMEAHYFNASAAGNAPNISPTGIT